jgi:hypothetical protein
MEEEEEEEGRRRRRRRRENYDLLISTTQGLHMPHIKKR